MGFCSPLVPSIGPGNSLSTAALLSRSAPSGTTCKTSLAFGSLPELNNFQLLPSHGEASSVAPRQTDLSAAPGFSAWHFTSAGDSHINSQDLPGSTTDTMLPRGVNSPRGSRDGFKFAALNDTVWFAAPFESSRDATISKFL